MHDTGKVDCQRGPYCAWAVIAIGLSHFLWPSAFDPINRLAFPRYPRRFTYVNGAIETAIGVLMVRSETRRLSRVAGACYATYLAGNVARHKRRI
ncbi:hypothetical protein A5645_03420 [Mycobacterium asiaticum]|nr:hypothetical protein A5645_03420 [Mycobacterium asiaticum]